ncbi:MAG: glycosyltransferase [Chloroflexaceae bacterium]|nr:glycosyltransferase [Chloroflexaceae bacterium]
MPCQIDDISVVLPTLNEQRNIATFLASLPPAVELVVVDASTDGTDQLIMALRPERTRVIRSTAGLTMARQIGAEAAQGQWLVFTDADVCFEPGYFDYLCRSINADAFYGPKYATVAHPIYSRLFIAWQVSIHRLGTAASSGSNMGMHRDVFAQLGGFRLDLPVNEDTELMMRARRRGFRVDYIHGLAVRSIDDRRLQRGVIFKTVHSVSRNTLLFVDMYIPIPRRWLSHDWGYWSFSHAHRSDL